MGILRISVGIFFLLIGVAGILPNVDESIFSLGYKKYNLEVVFGVIEVLCGIVILGGFFTRSRSNMYKATLVIFILWTARIVLSQLIFRDFPTTFEPMLARLIVITAEAVIATAIWNLSSAYD